MIQFASTSTLYRSILQVNRLDESMLKFPDLQELTLSANLLTTVDCKYLPRSLTVGHQIIDLCGTNGGHIMLVISDVGVTLEDKIGSGHIRIFASYRNCNNIGKNTII